MRMTTPAHSWTQFLSTIFLPSLMTFQPAAEPGFLWPHSCQRKPGSAAGWKGSSASAGMWSKETGLSCRLEGHHLLTRLSCSQLDLVSLPTLFLFVLSTLPASSWTQFPSTTFLPLLSISLATTSHTNQLLQLHLPWSTQWPATQTPATPSAFFKPFWPSTPQWWFYTACMICLTKACYF